MKCPECNTKITAKHYDAEYEWYECPGCEGAFTVDEIQGGTDGEQNRNGKADQGRKAGRGRGAKRKDTGGADAEIQKTLGVTKSGIVAKGKKRLTQIQEDDEVIKKHEEEILVPKVKQVEPKHHRDEVESRQVINIWGDELEDLYHELGLTIDTPNAQDKALILWREIHIQHAVTAREAEVPHAACKEHE